MRISAKFEWPEDRLAISFLATLPTRRRGEGLRSLLRVGELIDDGRLALVQKPVEFENLVGDVDSVNLHLQRPMDDRIIKKLENLTLHRQRAKVAELANLGAMALGNYQKYEIQFVGAGALNLSTANSASPISSHKDSETDSVVPVPEAQADYFDTAGLDLDLVTL